MIVHIGQKRDLFNFLQNPDCPQSSNYENWPRRQLFVVHIRNTTHPVSTQPQRVARLINVSTKIIIRRPCFYVFIFGTAVLNTHTQNPTYMTASHDYFWLIKIYND